MTIITGTYLHPDGTPSSGHVEFILRPPSLMSSGEQITCSRVAAPLDDSGSFAIDLVPASELEGTDGPILYEVLEVVDGCDRGPWYLFLGDDPIDLPAQWPGEPKPTGKGLE